jgi:quercetin dioxygenase-like cupin family protein
MGDDSMSQIEVVSLLEAAQAAQQDGPAWTRETDDLNVNLVILRAGHSIAEHVNNEVDVVLIGVDGTGRVTIDGDAVELAATQLLVVPKGAARSIVPLGARFAYVTCHKRRAGLWPTSPG